MRNHKPPAIPFLIEAVLNLRQKHINHNMSISLPHKDISSIYWHRYKVNALYIVCFLYTIIILFVLIVFVTSELP